MLRLLVPTLAAAAILAVPPARSAPRPDLGARAQRVLAEVDALDRQVEQVAEAYDAARIDLAQTTRDLRTNARELRTASRNLERAQAALVRLVVAKYESDELAPALGVVVGANSLGDVIDRVEAVRLVARQDAQILRDVRAFRARTLAERRELRQAQRARRDLLEGLRRRRAEIAGRLADRLRLLGSIRAEVARIRERDRLQQLRLRRQAEARIAARRVGRAAAPAVLGRLADDAGGETTTTAAPPSAAPASRHGHVVPILMRYLGTPYRWGGASPGTGFDCSGLVLYAYAQVGISLPHNAAMQYGYGSPVDRSDLQPGDIVFFNGLGHNGVYIGGGQFVDAPRTGDVVKIENLDDPWWSSAYVGARRLP